MLGYVLLRVVHIVAGTCWAGAAMLLAWFVEPAVRATGPAGGAVMQRLAGPGRLSLYMSIAASLTTLTGLVMYWPASGHLSLAWMGTAPGLTLTIGSVAGVTAFLIGMLMNAPAADRMAALGSAIQAQGGPPTAEQQAEIARLQQRLHRGAQMGAVLVLIATAGMAAANYLA